MQSLIVGQKIKIRYKLVTAKVKVLAIYPSYILFKFKNYRMCFLKSDFIDGTVKIIE